MHRLLMFLFGGLSLALGLWVSSLYFRSDFPPPEPLLVGLDGVAHPLSEWSGKVRIVNFWASWCQPCRQEMKDFVDLQDRWTPLGIQFVGVALDDPENVRRYLLSNPVNYPILLGDDAAPEWAARLGNELEALPFTVIFDAKGRRVHSRMGLIRPAEIESVLKNMGVLQP